MKAVSVDIRREKGVLVATLAGDWVIAQGRGMAECIERIRQHLDGAREIRLDGHQVGRMDSSGVWLIEKFRREIDRGDLAVRVDGFREADFELVRSLDGSDLAPRQPPSRWQSVTRPVSLVGAKMYSGASHLLEATAFFGQMSAALFRCLRRPRRLRLSFMVAIMERAGVNAIPIVALLAFLVAVVLAYQGAGELRRFGAEIFTVQLTVASMLREMGVLVTAILVAGRSGSAFTSEIGIMKINEEIDAMMTMGLDPFEVLVLPRVIALVIMLPLLTLVANVAGIFGAAVSTYMMLGLSVDAFLVNAREVMTWSNFWSGMLKAPVFAFLIASTGTFWGMRVEGSASSVGRLATASVVQSLFLVVLADTALSILYGRLGF